MAHRAKLKRESKHLGFSAGEIAMVWADVQGCELDVIESGELLWAAGAPLWAEIEPHSLRRQGTLEVLAPRAAAHFDRFILASDLIASGFPGRIVQDRQPWVWREPAGAVEAELIKS